MSERIEVTGADVDYRDGDVLCEGYLAHPKEAPVKRPGVLVVHDRMGIGAATKRRAEMLAELGYVALCVDAFGKGVRPASPDEAGQALRKVMGDRPRLLQRLRATYEVLARHERADAGRMAAIGFCFGGACVLEMARAGMDLRGVVSFHGGLGTPTPAEPGAVKAKVLVLHGADDPVVPAEQVRAFEKEMREAQADWTFVAYGGAVHGFTNPGSGKAAQERADKRSWVAMRCFFEEIFGA
ncbi:MAG: dienelactone hydrolase family protein [Planctomycetota bacterium]|nr:dienelactone hydrolase family protein [Planctomycetota bacterium]